MEEQLLELILTCQKENIELAFILMESQGIDTKDFIERHFGELLDFLKLGFPRHSSIVEHLLCAAPRIRAQNYNKSSRIKIPKSIRFLKKVKRLSIVNLDLVEIPNELFELTQLRHLDLYNNQIKTISEEISKLTNLRELYLRGNPLSEEEQEKISKCLPDCIINFV